MAKLTQKLSIFRYDVIRINERHVDCRFDLIFRDILRKSIELQSAKNIKGF